MNPEPRRWPKLLLIAGLLLVLLLALVYVGLNRAFPPERLAALLSAQVTEATGRSFQIGGPLSIRVLPRIAVVAQQVALGNAGWGSRPQMLTVREAAFEIRLWPLLKGEVNIDRVALQGVDLLLQTDRNGLGNWVVHERPGPPAGTGASPVQSIALAQLQLADAHVAFRDGRSGAQHAVELKRLDLDRDGDAAKLDGQFVVKGQVWNLQGRLGSLARLSANSADWPFDLQLSGDGARLAAKGQLLAGALPRSVSAELNGRVDKGAALAPWLGDAWSLPLPIELKTTLQHTPQDIRADALQLTLAGQHLSGRVAVTNGSPWAVDAQLSSPSIDLTRWRPRPAAPTAGAAERKRLFGHQPIGFDALPQGPARVALKVQRLLLPDLPPLSALNAQLNARPGAFNVDGLSFGVAGGTVRGHLKVVPRPGAAPQVALQLDAGELSVDTLLAAAGASGYASGGRLQLHGALNMAGDTAQALAAGANGEVLVRVAGTTLSGGASPFGPNLLPRLLQAIRGQPQAQDKTRIECAVLRLPLRNGAARIDRSIAIETDQLNIVGNGNVQLADETLQLAIRPQSKSGRGLNTHLSSLVVVRGTLLEPTISLDPKALAGLALELGAAGATGGLSVLAERLLRQPADPQPCQTAAAGSTGTTGKPADQPAASPKAAPAPPPKELPGPLRNIFR